eukprot:6209565-Pleurochrysis_carterae.AAC.1
MCLKPAQIASKQQAQHAELVDTAAAASAAAPSGVAVERARLEAPRSGSAVEQALLLLACARARVA